MADTAANGKQTPAAQDRVCLGVVAGARGLKGELRIKSFTEVAADVAGYGPVVTDDGQTLTLNVIGEAKGVIVACTEGVTDRTQAEKLKGQRLYVARDALPATQDEDEFYHADLIGLDVVDETEQPCGTVIALYNFGGGDIIDVRRPAGRSVMVPFTMAAVPVIDTAAGRIVVDSSALTQGDAGPDPATDGEPEP